MALQLVCGQSRALSILKYWQVLLFLVGDMAKGFVIPGKRVREKLNGHYVSVILPGKKLSYEEGTRRMIELFKKIKASKPAAHSPKFSQ